MSNKISYSKFTKLLSQYGYMCSMIYFVSSSSQKNSQIVKHAIFFEIRLPRTQKSIIVYLPENKYSMELPSDINHKTVEIVLSSDES